MSSGRCASLDSATGHAGFQAHLQERAAPGRSRRRGLRSPAVDTSTATPDSAIASIAELVVAAQVALGQRALGRPQTFTRSGWARMSNRPLRAASPSVWK